MSDLSLARRRALVILAPSSLQRLAEGLKPWVFRGWDFQPVPLDQPPAKILSLLAKVNPDGVILEFEPDLAEGVFAFAKPTVILFADLLIEGAACLNVDDYAMGRRAAAYFLERGLPHFAYCGRPLAHAPERQTGFRDALREEGHQPLMFEEANSSGQSRLPWAPASRRLQRWLTALPAPCGIFAAHDTLARTISEAARSLNLRIPDDLAILSANDDPVVCELGEPLLSCLETPWAEIASAGVSSLNRLVCGERAPDDPLLIAPRGVISRVSTEIIAAPDPLVARALRHARDNLGHLESVADWAREIGTNRRKLERAFQESQRQSPHQALIRLRVARARLRLLESDSPLAEIAADCGFSRPEKLSIHVRRLTGCSPSSLRREKKR